MAHPRPVCKNILGGIGLCHDTADAQRIPQAFQWEILKILENHTQKKSWLCGIPQRCFPCGKRNALAWRIFVCELPHSHMWYVSLQLMCAMCYVWCCSSSQTHASTFAHSRIHTAWHDAILCATCLILIRGMSHYNLFIRCVCVVLQL